MPEALHVAALMRKVLKLRLLLYASVIGLLAFVSHQRWTIHRLNMQTIAARANYSLIEPGFYLGGSQSKPPEATAVLNLSRYKDDYSAQFYEWQAIDDGRVAPSLEWLRAQVDFIDQQRRAGRTVFVHCDAGVSRSAMVSAAYFMWRDHLSRDQALAYLRTARPRIYPNPVFMELLTDWEKSLSQVHR
jgi:hypothetical protein